MSDAEILVREIREGYFEVSFTGEERPNIGVCDQFKSEAEAVAFANGWASGYEAARRDVVYYLEGGGQDYPPSTRVVES